MSYQYPTTTTIAAAFTEGIRAHSGRVTETFDDGTRLFSRSLLPRVEEVRVADQMQGGLALRATESEIWLHPYLFRQVCSNGAIMAQTLDSCCVECTEFDTEAELIQSLHRAISACSAEHVFSKALADVRRSVDAKVDLALNMAPLLSRLGNMVPRELLVQIFRRFTSDQDHTRFSLMNAVTSVARDTRDPEQRWRLEELGGSIGAGVGLLQPEDGDALHRTGELIGAR